MRIFVAACLVICLATAARAAPHHVHHAAQPAALPAVMPGEDGYDLWLRYRPIETARLAYYRSYATAIVGGDSATLKAAESELKRGFDGLLSQDTPVNAGLRDGAVVLATPADMHGLKVDLGKAGDEGFVITQAEQNGKRITVIAGNSDKGVLYGAFRYLREIQTRQGLDAIDIADAPKVKLRVMDHWDNLTGTIERGYAGFSIWDWWRLPDVVDPRYTDYARAEASIGVNGVVVNNVGAKSDSLTHDYLIKLKALADVMRPYGIRVYLSARWTAPMELSGLKTADPLDPDVAAWWKAKADEIYTIIPDFGGFLVKANSEGQPGPGDYGRNHAEGANMLAAALKPHGGVVMWRAFVYSEKDATDRAKQAYNEFKPLDGQFADNVLLQIKNGPIDFQPREPFHPLFGAMPKTNEMLEVQLTKEYLGQATHLVYLGALFKEALDADTYAQGPGSTVARVTDGDLDHHSLTGMAGVANIGDDRNWTGLDFGQADWYAFGRLAWNPDDSAEDIAKDWLKMTFSNDPRFVDPMADMMMKSRETVVKYMTPLGLHHQMATGHHYGPGPWVCDLARPEWNPCYYAQADAKGVGFDRTATGSNALEQYAPQAAAQWTDPATTDPKYLLWFHHLPWTYRMQDGGTLWDDMVGQYDEGVSEVQAMQAQWAGMKPYVDPQRFAAVSANLQIQAREAKWWRDAMIAYFQSKNGLPLPAGHATPEHDLDYYEKLDYTYAPGHPVQ